MLLLLPHLHTLIQFCISGSVRIQLVAMQYTSNKFCTPNTLACAQSKMIHQAYKWFWKYSHINSKWICECWDILHIPHIVYFVNDLWYFLMVTDKLFKVEYTVLVMILNICMHMMLLLLKGIFFWKYLQQPCLLKQKINESCDKIREIAWKQKWCTMQLTSFSQTAQHMLSIIN